MKILMLLALAAPVASAADIDVPADHPTIQAAIVAAAPGDTIHVAPGTWIEALDYLGKDIVVTASGGSQVTHLKAPAGKSAARFTAGEPPTAALIGFHITDNGDLDFNALVQITAASPSLIDCDIEGMEAAAVSITNGSPQLFACEIHDGRPATGRGLVLSGSDAVVHSCSIHDLDQAALATLRHSRPTISHSVIRDCAWGIVTSTDAPVSGIEASRVFVERSTFARNFQDPANGAAIQVGHRLAATITDCLFLDHQAQCIVAGGSLPPKGELVIQRCQFFDQATTQFRIETHGTANVQITQSQLALDPTGPQTGGGIRIHDFGGALVQYVTVAGFAIGTDIDFTGLAAYDSCLFGFQAPGQAFLGVGPNMSGVTNNQGAGPSATTITDPGFVDYASRDLHLLSTSVAIAQALFLTGATDIDGDPRPLPADWGADEFQSRSLWTRGNPLSGGSLEAVFQGTPGDPVLLGIATTQLPTPIPTILGDYQLGGIPTFMSLGQIPPNGTLAFPTTAPTLATPGTVYVQALIGVALTPVREVVLGG